GYGAFVRVLVDKTPRLTAVEIDPPMAERLQRLYGDRARIINGDGTDTGLPDNEFSSVVSFTMLHHVPTAELQDRLFAEAFRVLRPGAALVASDSLGSDELKAHHDGDTSTPVAPATLRERLAAAGFNDVQVKTNEYGWA